MPADPAPVTVTLNDGEDHYLRYGINALCAFEDLTGQPLTTITDADNIGVKQLRALVWAGLQNASEEKAHVACPSVGEVGDLLDGVDFETVMDQAMKAIERAFPEKPQGGNRGKRRPATKPAP